MAESSTEHLASHASTVPGMELAATLAYSHHTPIDYIVGSAQMIEAAGLAGIWVPEHVVFMQDFASKYPYTKDGSLPGNPDGVLDPFTALTFVAANTSTLRLGTGVCLVPQRQPIYTAKMVADLDYLSGGRVDFGIGIGWLEEEFDALGMDFAARAARTNEYVETMKALWTQSPASFEGETVSFTNVHFNPKPVQTPHPPIFVGGESKPALRRVASFAQGWYGYNLTPDELVERLQRLDEHLEAAGRTRADIKIYCSPNRQKIDRETADAYRAAGVEQLIMPLFARDLAGLETRIAALKESVGL